MNDNIIETGELAKHYRDVAALSEITVAVPAGQVVGLLGHNGAGKSTLIKLMLGLIRPSSGQIAVLGVAPWQSHSVAFRRRIGYLPESARFYGNLTGFEVIDYLADLKRVGRSEAHELLARVGLSDAGNRRVHTYSKGMRQRLGFAQALLGAPELIVLDEPTSGLDPQATRELYDAIDELRAAGRSVIVSSHVLAELEPHIDAAMILREGTLLAMGSVDALRRQARLPDLLTVRLKPTTPAAIFGAELQSRGVGFTKGRDGGFEIEVPADRKLALVRDLVAHPAVIDLGIREASLARLYGYLGSVQAVDGRQS